MHVGEGTLASADTARTETLLALRPRYRGPAPQPLHEHPIFWAFLALIPIPAITLRSREKRRLAMPKAAMGQAKLAALAKTAVPDRDPCEVRRIYTNALAERLGLAPESFTRAGGLARALRRRGVSTDVALEAEKFLRELDTAAFAQHGALPHDAAERAATLYRTVDEEALPRTQIPATVFSIVALLAIGVATAHAFDASAARRAFDEGVVAYEHHNFVAARESFIASVTADPRAPDAWANLGTASWAVADTARSVAAWQRALRIEPLASDVRERVELVHALPFTSAGYVVPIPIGGVFEVAALIWVLAWGIAAYRSARGGALRTRDLATLSAIAGIIAITGFALSDRTSGRRAAVLRRTSSLSTDPELGGERGATAIIGEVVRVTGRQGAWTRVALDDGRDGWIENSAIISLDPRDASQISD